MRGSYTRGVFFVHSTPPALCPHIEWALGTALGQEVRLQWTDQDAAPGMVRCEFSWVGPVGSGARLASALRGWEHLRYEVTEEATASNDGGRWCHTPSLGIFHSQMDSVGNVVVPEDRIRAAMENASSYEELVEGLELALGQGYDLILTSGGTGLAPRDTTPEALLPIFERRLPGFEQAMMQASLAKTPTAAISRAVAGTLGRTIVITLPGSRKAVSENLAAILPALGHALEKLHGDPSDCGKRA